MICPEPNDLDPRKLAKIVKLGGFPAFGGSKIIQLSEIWELHGYQN